MNLLQRLRFLFDEQYSLWHVARMASLHPQPTTTQPITALDVEDNIHLAETRQIRALPKAQQAPAPCTIEESSTGLPKRNEYQTDALEMLATTEHFKALAKERKKELL